ncbi:MAG TPA: Fe-S protein assembly chaperone HscA [Alphaproteobacteria bacterium]|nr:Fe-S protein assembly chaperone HscA [Alphaproteobacteria bacterium]
MSEVLLQIHEPGETPMPHDDPRGLAVGIDLGTTNSVVAIAHEQKPEVLRDEAGHGLVPSLVAYREDGQVVVGAPARRLLLDHPGIVVGSIKRLMGRGAEDLKALAGSLPYELASPAEGGMVRLKIGDRVLTPVEISADILRAVKARAEVALGQTVTRAVITVPAYFDDAARTATRDAARLAGLDVLRLVNEPTAAALAYGLDKGAEGLYAIYDLGGGTFDFSLLRLEKGVFQVLATGGDAQLGGDDFDHAIAERFLAERGGEVDSVRAKLALATARVAKECLTTQSEWQGALDLDGRPSLHRIDRTTFERLIQSWVGRTITIVERVLEDAGIEPASVNGVVLVGGSTRVPLVRRSVGALFGRPALADIDPDEVVALGAALQAEALTRGSDTLLLDVTPLSLGIETMGGIVEKIIERNTAIPTAMAQEFTTYQDGQSAMMIHVVQGERETVDRCRSLARFALNGIPPMTAGAARIRVSFAVDADGLLTVSARENTTGVEARVEVKPTYGLAEDEMAVMLRDSLEHAREDMERRLLLEAQVEARRTVNVVRSALASDGELLSAEERALIENTVARAEATAESGNRLAIRAAAEELERMTRPFAERRMDRGIRAALAGRHVDTLRS